MKGRALMSHSGVSPPTVATLARRFGVASVSKESHMDDGLKARRAAPLGVGPVAGYEEMFARSLRREPLYQAEKRLRQRWTDSRPSAGISRHGEARNRTIQAEGCSALPVLKTGWAYDSNRVSALHSDGLEDREASFRSLAGS